jgi:hypothetical protein
VQLQFFVGLNVGSNQRPLTDTKARTIKPDDKNLADGTVMGLTLQPTATKGRGRWNLRFVSPVRKKRRDMGLGVYPEVPIVEARRLAEMSRVQSSAYFTARSNSASVAQVCSRSRAGVVLWLMLLILQTMDAVPSSGRSWTL